jgi:hypothetical protein
MNLRIKLSMLLYPMSRFSKPRRCLKEVALVKLPSVTQDQKAISTRTCSVLVSTNLLRETARDLTVEGTPLSHANWLESLLPR